MLELSFEEIVKAVSGEVLKKPLNKIIEKVSTDTRKIEKNSMFIALKGENFNGNNYILEAFKKGASVSIIDEVKYEVNELKAENGVIKVTDTRKALRDLAKFYREKLGVKIIGITGSTGKTSTKDLLAAMLSKNYKVFKTKGNFNNDIGLPLMVLELDKSYDIAVLEMGMSNLGEIHTLSEISSPDMAIITNIGLSHIENLKTRDNILKAKMEIADFFGQNNILVVNGNDDKLKLISNDNFKIIKTGIGKDFNIGATNIEINELSSKFTVKYNNETYDFSLDMPGKHNIENFMLGLCICKELKISFKDIEEGLKNIEATSMRLEVLKDKEFTVVNDCYNSSPSSVKSAIDVIMKMKGNRKIAVLGTMKELGDESPNAHREIGKYAKEQGIDMVFASGDYSEFIKEGFNKGCTVYCSKEDLLKDLKDTVNKDDILLIKASRSMKFEEITKGLLK